MSHTISAKIKLVDKELVTKAATELGFEVLGDQQHQLYAGAVDGIGVKLPGWRYPAVVLADGTIRYDNYHGSWGQQTELDKLCQAYAIAAAEQQADDYGWMFDKTTLANGDVQIELTKVQAVA